VCGSNPYPTVWHYIWTKNFQTIAILTQRSSSQEHELGNHHHKYINMKNYAQPKHGENVHLNKKHRIKESHTVRISSVEQRNNQSLIHKANRRRKTRAKGRQSDRQNREEKKKREREKYQGKKHKPHGYSALVSHIKLRGEAFTWRRRRSQRQTFPGRQTSRLGSRDLCCNRDHKGGHGYAHSRHTRHLAATLLY